MLWLNLPTNIIRSPQYAGCDPAVRATWFNLMAYCAEQENSGKIENCREWKCRRWQQTCGVMREEVLEESTLWTWEGDTLVVTFYPENAQEKAQKHRAAGASGGAKTSPEKAAAARANGLKGVQARINAKTQAEANVLTQAPTQAIDPSHPRPDPTKGNKREGNEKELKGERVNAGEPEAEPTGSSKDEEDAAEAEDEAAPPLSVASRRPEGLADKGEVLHGDENSVPGEKELEDDLVPPRPPVVASLEFVERIVRAYPRQDAPVHCRHLVQTSLQRGEDAAKLLACVQECARLIAQAPQGSANKFVPMARRFFEDEQWKSPEKFKGLNRSPPSGFTGGRSPTAYQPEAPGDGWAALTAQHDPGREVRT